LIDLRKKDAKLFRKNVKSWEEGEEARCYGRLREKWICETVEIKLIELDFE